MNSVILFVVFYLLGMILSFYVVYDWTKHGIANKLRLPARYMSGAFSCLFFSASFFFNGEGYTSIWFIVMSLLCLGIHFIYKSE